MNNEVENIGNLVKSEMGKYGINVIAKRAVADYRDGLLPVYRRILYCMYKDEKVLPNKPQKKVIGIEGTIIKLYHPHGSCVGSIVKLAQPWINNQTLVDGHGNFGNQAGDNHAASRYIKARMSQYAYDCFFRDFKEHSNIVDMKVASDDSVMEPLFLPARYPNVLVNGGAGIAFSIVSYIPPHNFSELCMETIKLLRNPDAKLELYPDFPTGSEILNKEDIPKIYEEGSGSIKIRAKMEVSKDGTEIYVSNIPYLTTGNKIMEKIMELVTSKEIEGLKDLVEVDADNGKKKKKKKKSGKKEKTNPEVKFKLVLKRGADPYYIIDTLYKKTVLATSFTVRMNVLDGIDLNRRLSVKELILNWIEFRRSTKYRILANSLVTVNTDIHVTESLLKIFNSKNFDKVIKGIRNAGGRKEVIEMLIDGFDLSDIQAEKIADNQVYKLHKNRKFELEEQLKNLHEHRTLLEDVLKNPSNIDDIIEAELLEGIAKYGTPRKCKLISKSRASVIPDTEHVITISKHGYIKKLAGDTDILGEFKQGDSLQCHIQNVKNTDELYLFSKYGKVYKLPVAIIKSANHMNGGVSLDNYLSLDSDIIKVYKESDFIKTKNKFLVCLSKDGQIKKSELALYNVKSSLVYMRLRDTDEVVDVQVVKGNTSDIVPYSVNGKCTVFGCNDLTTYSRNTIGVTVGNFDSPMQGFNVIKQSDTNLVVVTNKGNAKRIDIDALPSHKRGKKITKITNLGANECIKYIESGKAKKCVITRSDNMHGESLDIDVIPELTRISKCKKTFINADKIIRVEI